MNLFSYEIMKRAVELYEKQGDSIKEEKSYDGKRFIWEWCVNTALAEHNYAID